MQEHPNATAMRRMMEAINQGDMTAMGEQLADDVEWHMIGASEPVRGKQALSAMMSGGGDVSFNSVVHDVVANDDHSVALVETTARRGDRSLTDRTAEILHFRNGKITARWAFSDDTGAINAFFA